MPKHLLHARIENLRIIWVAKKEAAALFKILGRFCKIFKFGSWYLMGSKKRYSSHATDDSDKLKPHSRPFYDFLVAPRQVGGSN